MSVNIGRSMDITLCGSTMRAALVSSIQSAICGTQLILQIIQMSCAIIEMQFLKSCEAYVNANVPKASGPTFPLHEYQ